MVILPKQLIDTVNALLR